ncbi:peroxidase 40 [Canna indica]|uniref:Peroxidase n=1 Tax=Canna indica TaxID=4628 RepID=A0AAQ3K391_9LILI|nr:peroxidase 40 [Canna indica]
MLTIISYGMILLLLSLPTPLDASSKDCIGIGGGASGTVGGGIAGGSLQFDLYITSCPQAEDIIFSGVQRAIAADPRMAASLLRLHFHDCFVNGCDASLLLDDAPGFVGEKTAGPNANSLRGFDVVDCIKSELEMACPETVSCADLLAIAARDSVVLSGGPTWRVEVGRRDGTTASRALANTYLPSPTSSVAILVQNFQNVGLSAKDLVALSGAHTIGKARCSSFVSRLNGGGGGAAAGDGEVVFIQSLQQLCAGSNGTLARLDLATPVAFDNQYYVNLLTGEGLLPSDQILVSGADEVGGLVQAYAMDSALFFEDFAASMERMGRLAPPQGSGGEIRRSCRVVN